MQDAGALMDHFQHLTEAQEADRLEKVEGTTGPSPRWRTCCGCTGRW